MKTSKLLYWSAIYLCKTNIWKPQSCGIGMEFSFEKLTDGSLKVVVLECNLVV